MEQAAAEAEMQVTVTNVVDVAADIDSLDQNIMAGVLERNLTNESMDTKQHVPDLTEYVSDLSIPLSLALSSFDVQNNKNRQPIIGFQTKYVCRRGETAGISRAK